MKLANVLPWACLSIVVACEPAETITAASPDARPQKPEVPPQTIKWTGKVVDCFDGTPLKAATMATEGLKPAVTATTADDGTFSATIPVSSAFTAVWSFAGYGKGRLSLEVKEAAVTQDVLLAPYSSVGRQYTTLNLAQAPGAGTIFMLLLKPDGTPLEGVPLANITLVDEGNVVVAGASGPYFFGVTGDVQPQGTLATSTAYNGKVLAAYLNVPAGKVQVKVGFTDGAATKTFSVPVTVVAGDTTIVATGGTPGDAPPAPANPKFTTHVFPLLQRPSVNAAGRGCASCHTAGGQMAAMPLDGDAATVYTALLNRAGVINTTTPATSLLLTNPLFEDPADHPNATFLTVNDPAYKMMLAWITSGAMQ